MARDLYREAVTQGTKHFQQLELGLSPFDEPLVLGPEGPGYWIARYAARQAAKALLIEARQLGVTDTQYRSPAGGGSGGGV